MCPNVIVAHIYQIYQRFGVDFVGELKIKRNIVSKYELVKVLAENTHRHIKFTNLSNKTLHEDLDEVCNVWQNFQNVISDLLS